MKKSLLTAMIFLTSSILFAHGEDKVGPNGGFVRMPGAYHTEVVPEGSDKFRVYLLDINWKNPTVTASEVKAQQVVGKKKSDIKCEVQTDYFLCRLPKGANLNKGKLVLESTRESQKGVTATYPLPLKLEKATPKPETSKPETSNPHAHH